MLPFRTVNLVVCNTATIAVYCKSQGTRDYTVWTKCWYFTVKPCGRDTNHRAAVACVLTALEVHTDILHCFSETSIPALRTTKPPTLFVRGSYTGAKRSRHEIYHSPVSSAELKNEWSYTSTPPICLHDAARHNFTFYLIPLYEFVSPQFVTSRVPVSAAT